MSKDEMIEALTQEVWAELPPNRHWAEMGPAQEKTAVCIALRKSATLVMLLAQSASHAAALADRDRHAQSAEVWRKRVEAAADALADVLPGEVGRLDLVARIAELKRQRDALKAQLAETGTYERGREVERLNWQNATGASTPRDATGFLRPKGHEIDTLSVRDEFAKAAMQASLGDTWRSESSATMGEFAARAYRMADAMLFARGGAVDLTREQEKETQAPAGHKPTCQNGKHDPVANRPWGCTCRPVRGPAIVPPLGAP